MAKIKFIDNEKEHNQVLYELGILDDDDDYPLFCKMQSNEGYDTQEFPINPEVEQYIVDNKLYEIRNNYSYEEYVYVKNQNTNEIHLMSQQVYLNTKQMLGLEQDLVAKGNSINVKKL